MSFRSWLNDNVGPLMATAVIAIAGQSIVSYGNDERVDEQILNLQDFARQQRQLNEASIKISESVAVMAVRMNHVEQDIDRIYVNLPATNTGSTKN